MLFVLDQIHFSLNPFSDDILDDVNFLGTIECQDSGTKSAFHSLLHIVAKIQSFGDKNKPHFLLDLRLNPFQQAVKKDLPLGFDQFLGMLDQNNVEFWATHNELI